MNIYGVTGWKNSGKTGLVERLVTELTGRGLRVSTVKHAHHGFDVDQPGRDSFRHREAGAEQVLLVSNRRWALMRELRDAPEPTLEEMLGQLAPVDLVLVEGFKRDRHPKIEAHRAETGHSLIALQDETIRAIASNTPDALQAMAPDRVVFDLDDTVALADFVLREVKLS